MAANNKGTPVLESYSLRSGLLTARLAELPEVSSTPVLRSGATLWLTRSSGPRARNDTAGGDPEPDDPLYRLPDLSALTAQEQRELIGAARVVAELIAKAEREAERRGA